MFAMCASHDPYSLQQLIDYDTEVSQLLLEYPIRSLEGINSFDW